MKRDNQEGIRRERVIECEFESLLPAQRLELHVFVISSAAVEQLIVRARLAYCTVLNKVSARDLSLLHDRRRYRQWNAYMQSAF